jgi:hypothetical protein
MKHFLAQTIILAFVVSQTTSANQDQHLQEMNKDAIVMQNIIETTSQPTLGAVQVQSTYLLGQGLIFELKSNLMFGVPKQSAFAPPPPPAFTGHVNVEDWVDMYADWGDSIAEMSQEAMNVSLSNSFEQGEDGQQVIDYIKKQKQKLKESLNLEKEKLKELYKAKHLLDRQLERKLEAFVKAPAQNEYEKKQLEIELIKEKQNELGLIIDQTRKKRREHAASFKQNILQEREKKQQIYETTILTNFCEYSLSLRHLKNNERVSFIFPNFSRPSNRKIYVFSHEQIKKCQTNEDKAENILSNVSHYEF